MKPSRKPLADVKEAIRQACYDHTGQALEELLDSMGWTLTEYKVALVESGAVQSPDGHGRMDT